ncbi:hypothetical protein DSO57_1011326 [Entomophthora muscae]|uniref:Uncharacterized protein n=1 Tax=Entomophthora muscae TaxID=34485 RepID=A0ACC2T6K2_9FUNG|nr:hypothetical protein DSO57_1011326 [Entomophthora muscae]
MCGRKSSLLHSVREISSLLPEVAMRGILENEARAASERQSLELLEKTVKQASERDFDMKLDKLVQLLACVVTRPSGDGFFNALLAQLSLRPFGDKAHGQAKELMLDFLHDKRLEALVIELNSVQEANKVALVDEACQTQVASKPHDMKVCSSEIQVPTVGFHFYNESELNLDEEIPFHPPSDSSNVPNTTTDVSTDEAGEVFQTNDHNSKHSHGDSGLDAASEDSNPLCSPLASPVLCPLEPTEDPPSLMLDHVSPIGSPPRYAHAVYG